MPGLVAGSTPSVFAKTWMTGTSAMTMGRRKIYRRTITVAPILARP